MRKLPRSYDSSRLIRFQQITRQTESFSNQSSPRSTYLDVCPASNFHPLSLFFFLARQITSTYYAMSPQCQNDTPTWMLWMLLIPRLLPYSIAFFDGLACCISKFCGTVRVYSSLSICLSSTWSGCMMRNKKALRQNLDDVRCWRGYRRWNPNPTTAVVGCFM